MVGWDCSCGILEELKTKSEELRVLLNKSINMKAIKYLTLTVLIALSATISSQEPVGNWERIWEMKSGFYRVMQNGLVGVVNSEGEILIPCQFDQIYDLTDDNYVKVLRNLKIGLYQLEFGMILPPDYDQIWAFEDGLAKVLKDRKIGYVNTNGEVIIPVEYNHIWEEDDGLIKVLKDGKMGFLNSNGEIILPADYQQIWSFDGDLAKILKNGKMGYIDRNGNEVIPPIYDQLGTFDGDIAKAMIGGANIFIDANGQAVDAPERSIYVNDIPLKAPKEPQIISIEDGGRVEIKNDGNQREIIIRREEPTTKKIVKRKNFYGSLDGINLGINGYLNSDFKEAVPDDYSFMDINNERSFEVSIYPFQHSIGLIGSHFGLVSALGIQFNNYRFNLYNSNELIGNETAQGWFHQMPDNSTISKAKLVFFSLNVPVMFELKLPSGQFNSLYLSGGVVGSLKFSSHSKVIYNSEDIKYKRKYSDNIGINVFRYSFMARAGYGDFGIYATYSPVSLFKSDRGPELFPYSVGVSLNF